MHVQPVVYVLYFLARKLQQRPGVCIWYSAIVHAGAVTTIHGRVGEIHPL